MDPSDWISIGSGGVALLAAGFAFWQARTAADSAKHAGRQAQAAEAQLNIAREQIQQAERVHREQLALAERVHREQNEPYVVVDIGPDQPGSSLLVLSIHNIGTTVARDVRIQVTPTLESSHAKFTPRLASALNRTIPMLPPNRRLVYAFDGPQRWSTDLPMRYDFTVDAHGPQGAVETLTYTVDLEALAGYLIGERPLKRIEEHLGKIDSRLDALADAYDKANSEAIRAHNGRMIEETRRQAEGPTEP
ncbi:hypothetical protein ACLGIH_19190 [Streptomyces sp. HMX87]|uniref:hypothetical protein n=1 Tax=Streptomyces sp. HMX87 TaxID=3390849 RepID=UPI003A8814B7